MINSKVQELRSNSSSRYILRLLTRYSIPFPEALQNAYLKQGYASFYQSLITTVDDFIAQQILMELSKHLIQTSHAQMKMQGYQYNELGKQVDTKKVDAIINSLSQMLWPMEGPLLWDVLKTHLTGSQVEVVGMLEDIFANDSVQMEKNIAEIVKKIYPELPTIAKEHSVNKIMKPVVQSKTKDKKDFRLIYYYYLVFKANKISEQFVPTKVQLVDSDAQHYAASRTNSLQDWYLMEYQVPAKDKDDPPPIVCISWSESSYCESSKQEQYRHNESKFILLDQSSMDTSLIKSLSKVQQCLAMLTLMPDEYVLSDLLQVLNKNQIFEMWISAEFMIFAQCENDMVKRLESLSVSPELARQLTVVQRTAPHLLDSFGVQLVDNVRIECRKYWQTKQDEEELQRVLNMQLEYQKFIQENQLVHGIPQNESIIDQEPRKVKNKEEQPVIAVEKKIKRKNRLMLSRPDKQPQPQNQSLAQEICRAIIIENKDEMQRQLEQLIQAILRHPEFGKSIEVLKEKKKDRDPQIQHKLVKMLVLQIVGTATYLSLGDKAVDDMLECLMIGGSNVELNIHPKVEFSRLVNQLQANILSRTLQRDEGPIELYNPFDTFKFSLDPLL